MTNQYTLKQNRDTKESGIKIKYKQKDGFD